MNAQNKTVASAAPTRYGKDLNTAYRHAERLGWIAFTNAFVAALSIFWSTDFMAGVGLGSALMALCAGVWRLALLNREVSRKGEVNV